MRTTPTYPRCRGHPLNTPHPTDASNHANTPHTPDDDDVAIGNEKPPRDNTSGVGTTTCPRMLSILGALILWGERAELHPQHRHRHHHDHHFPHLTRSPAEAEAGVDKYTALAPAAPPASTTATPSSRTAWTVPGPRAVNTAAPGTAMLEAMASLARNAVARPPPPPPLVRFRIRHDSSDTWGWDGRGTRIARRTAQGGGGGGIK